MMANDNHNNHDGYGIDHYDKCLKIICTLITMISIVTILFSAKADNEFTSVIIESMIHIIFFILIGFFTLRRKFIDFLIDIYLIWKINFFAKGNDKSAFINLMMNRTKSFTYIFLFSIIIGTIYEVFIKN